MDLAPQPPVFNYVVTNISGTPPANPGTGFTAVSVAAPDAAGVTCITLTADIYRLAVDIGGIAATGVDANAVLDVLYDPGGGTPATVAIPSLIAGFTNVQATTGALFSQSYLFPLRLPSGSTVGVRARGASGTPITTGFVAMTALGKPSYPVWAGQKVVAIGMNAATAMGTIITPDATAAPTTWANLGTLAGNAGGAIQISINGSDSAASARAYYAQVGISSNVIPGTETIAKFISSTEGGVAYGPRTEMFCNIPDGSLLQVRAGCSGTVENINMGAWVTYR